MPTNDVSLGGVRKYIEEGKGSLSNPNPHLSRDLNDLKNLVNELVDTRTGKTKVYGCNCHGNELHNGYTQTTCGSNTLTSHYSKSTISLGELLDYIEPARVCRCVAVKIEDCGCNTNCFCNCDVCHCNCDYCSCNCNYHSST